MTESSSALVCCTESAARSQLSKSMAASSSPMSVPAHCSLSPDLQRPGLVEVGNKLAGVGKLLDASRGDGGGRDGVRGAGGILAAGFLRGPQRVVSTRRSFRSSTRISVCELSRIFRISVSVRCISLSYADSSLSGGSVLLCTACGARGMAAGPGRRC